MMPSPGERSGGHVLPVLGRGVVGMGSGGNVLPVLGRGVVGMCYQSWGGEWACVTSPGEGSGGNVLPVLGRGVGMCYQS